MCMSVSCTRMHVCIRYTCACACHVHGCHVHVCAHVMYTPACTCHAVCHRHLSCLCMHVMCTGAVQVSHAMYTPACVCCTRLLHACVMYVRALHVVHVCMLRACVSCAHVCHVHVCVVPTHVCTCMRVDNLTPGGGRHIGVRSCGTGRVKGPRDFRGSLGQGTPAHLLAPCLQRFL